MLKAFGKVDRLQPRSILRPSAGQPYSSANLDADTCMPVAHKLGWAVDWVLQQLLMHEADAFLYNQLVSYKLAAPRLAAKRFYT